MKKVFGKVILAFFFSFLFLTACQKEEQPPQADVDVRDLYVGRYICEVTKKNFQTDVLLDSYLDTIDIAKKGEDSLALSNTQNIQLPNVIYLEGDENRSLFAAVVTIVAFDKGSVNITHGNDSAFYELKGIKKQ
jgi:hypothetical protein